MSILPFYDTIKKDKEKLGGNMDQEKVGQLIKELRIKHHLTQAEFAKRYHVTYQAVSKWENGKNMPDLALLKQICADFQMDIGDFLDGEITVKDAPKPKKSNKVKIGIVVIGIFIFILLVGGYFLFFQNDDFEFKTLSTSCSHFTISGSLAYNRNNSHLYISNIDYCGGEDNTLYQEISCVLYEVQDDSTTKISEAKYEGEEMVTLEEYLRGIDFKIDDFSSDCSRYSEGSLYLEINASNSLEKATTYRIPLSFNDRCTK